MAAQEDKLSGAPLSILILAGAQMRALLRTLQDDPTIARIYRDEARQVGRLWDAAAAELAAPLPAGDKSTPVIWLAEPDELFAQKGTKATKEDSSSLPLLPSVQKSGPPSRSDLKPRDNPGKRRGPRPLSAEVLEVRYLAIREALAGGPLKASHIAVRAGLTHTQTVQALERGPFQRLANKRWTLAEAEAA